VHNFLYTAGRRSSLQILQEPLECQQIRHPKMGSPGPEHYHRVRHTHARKGSRNRAQATTGVLVEDQILISDATPLHYLKLLANVRVKGMRDAKAL
jgi:hypothetical protein